MFVRSWVVTAILAVLIAAGGACGQKPAPKSPAVTVTPADLEAARAVGFPPFPDPGRLDRVAGSVNGTPISFGEVCGETVIRFAAPMIPTLARQTAMSMESVRRGVGVDDAAFAAAVRAFLERVGQGRTLAETLRARRFSWDRFEDAMRLSAAVQTMIESDLGPRPSDTRGRAWARKVLAGYHIRTDPWELDPGIYARVEAEWPLRVLLTAHLTGGHPARVVSTENDRELRIVFTAPGGRRIEARVANVQVALRTGRGVRGGSMALSEAWKRWTPGKFRVVPGDRRDPRLLAVAPDGAKVPEFRLTDVTARVTALVTDRMLLAERRADLKLRHLDEALTSLARHRAFAAAIREREIRVPKDQVRLRIAKERARYEGGDLTWDQAIQRVGRNVYTEARRFEVAEAVDRIMGTEVSDEVLRAYYAAHVDHFGRATVTASHILISEYDPLTGRVDFAKAKEKIREVYAKLKAGAEFIDLVQQYSQDRVSRTRGGDIGMFTLVSAYDEDFCRLAFALKENEVSPPVRTRRGWHIIYCRQRTAPETDAYPFEKVKGVVREDRQEDLRKHWLEEHVWRGLKLENKLKVDCME